MLVAAQHGEGYGEVAHLGVAVLTGIIRLDVQRYFLFHAVGTGWQRCQPVHGVA